MVLKRFCRKAWRFLARQSKVPTARPDPPENQGPLRCGIVGMGVMGQLHSATLKQNKCIKLVAVCVRDRAKTENLKLDCDIYDDYSRMLEEADLDLVIVATPHLQHKEFCIAAIRSGKHVICEKPMATTVKDATEILEAIDSHGVYLTVMSQTRFEPSYRHLKQLLDSGNIGRIHRCHFTETFWRPDSYYRSAPWRGTWAGEGGGVLANQAPHVLDRYRWLCGCPKSITAVCETLHHSIAVEDSATLICSHANGLTGQIHVSTNEYPTARMEFVCDRGRIVVQDGLITVTHWTPSLSESINQANVGGTSPVMQTKVHGGCLLNWSDSLLHDFYENFANAIWSGGKPLVSAIESSDVVHMINAAQLSAWKGCPISLPIDDDSHLLFLTMKIGNENTEVSR